MDSECPWCNVDGQLAAGDDNTIYCQSCRKCLDCGREAIGVGVSCMNDDCPRQRRYAKRATDQEAAEAVYRAEAEAWAALSAASRAKGNQLP